MTRVRNREKLVAFLKSIQRPDYPQETIEDKAGLVSSGLVDSLAILQIITYLEKEYNIDFVEKGIDPGSLSSISNILDLIDRETS